jgi:hypothetical protein
MSLTVNLSGKKVTHCPKCFRVHRLKATDEQVCPNCLYAYPGRLTVGMELYWVPTDSQKPHAVTVIKVGRTWATLSNGERIDKVTWKGEPKNYGHQVNGHVYKSEREYRDEVELQAAWDKLRRDLHYATQRTPVVTIEAIKQVRSSLGL